MRNLIYVGMLIMGQGLARADTTPPAESADTWIVSGQSNAGGVPPEEFTPPKTDRVQWYHLDDKKFSPVDGILTGLTRRFSPFHTAAYEVAQAGIAVNMLGYARSGAPIRHWLDPAPKDGEPSGWQILDTLIGEAGKGAGVFIWDQGGADRTMKPDLYQAAVTDLVARVRRAAENPQLTVVVIQSGGRSGRWAPDQIADIREAQRQFVVDDGNTLLIPAIGRDTVDGGHLSAKSQAEIGREIAHALLRVKYGRGSADWPGPVLDACVQGESPRTITLHFAEVVQLSGAEAKDFRVMDESGQVALVAVQTGQTLVTLTLERDLTGQANVSYAYDGNPAGLLRDEAGYRAPAVAAFHVDKSRAIPDEPTAATNGAGGTR